MSDHSSQTLITDHLPLLARWPISTYHIRTTRHAARATHHAPLTTCTTHHAPQVTKSDGSAALISSLKEGDVIVAATDDGKLTTDTVSLLSIADPQGDACVHVYGYQCVRACVQPYATCMRACVCACMHTYARSCVHAHVRACVRAYVRTRMRACMITYRLPPLNHRRLFADGRAPYRQPHAHAHT